MRSQRETENQSQYTIVVLGDVKSGKTTLVSQFLSDAIAPSYKPTIEECYRTLAKLPDGRYKTVNIVDTAGTMEFPAMRELRIRSATAIIIVYSAENSEGIKRVSIHKKEVQELRGYDGIPITVVGNKQNQNNNTINLNMPLGIMDDSSCEYSCIDMINTEQCKSVFRKVIDRCYESNTWKVEVWAVTTLQSNQNNKPKKKKGKFIRMLSFRRSKSRPHIPASKSGGLRSVQSMP